MVHFALCTDGKEMLFDTGASAKPADSVMRQQVVVNPFCGREDAHAFGTKCFQQSTVFKLANHIGGNVMMFKPSVQAITNRCVGRWQQNGYV